MTPSELSSDNKISLAFEALRQGRPVIVVDDESRENEGDFVFAAEKITPESINFMAKHGRGLICLAMTAERLKHLDIPLIRTKNNERSSTAFTVSIEARHGITTGISAADRAHTVQVAVNPKANANDLTQPGHIFPLQAQDGGVLSRAGHTEGSVDLARLAGLAPAGVICEIMNDDGTMARLPELQEIAEREGLLILSIADIIQYRLRQESCVEQVASTILSTQWGDLEAFAYRSTLDDREALALVCGDVSSAIPGNTPLVRVHSGDPLTEVFGGILDQGGLRLHAALDRIAKEARGVILYLPKEPEPMNFVAALQRASESHSQGLGLPEKVRAPEGLSPKIRHYGLGAQILRDLGLRQIRVMSNNPVRLSGIEGFGIEIVGTESLSPDA